MLAGRKIAVAVMLILVLATSVAFAQNKYKIKLHTPTVKGSSGLFNLPTADTFRAGEFSFGLYGSHFNREPGALDISTFPATFTIGLTDRIELFGAYEVYNRVHADSIAVDKVQPGNHPSCPIGVSSISACPVIPAGLPSGQSAYYNDYPFMDVGFGDGSGALHAGIKFNLMSERFGNPFGLAIQPRFKFNFKNSRTRLLRGLSSGVNDYGFDVIFSKNAGQGTVTATTGLMFAEDKAWADRQNAWNYGAGFEVPVGTPRVRAIAELMGTMFYGDRTTGLANPKWPLDIYGGLRFHPSNWVALGVAYNLYLNRADPDTYLVPSADRHGWLAHATFQRKVNRPPTAVCEAEAPSVVESNAVNLVANVDDEDDDVLTVTWKSAVGRLTQNENEAVFDSTGVTPGNYTIMAEVSDGELMSSCSVDIRVDKNMKPPTVSCQPSTASVTAGDSVTLRAQASDPNNDPLTYSWSVDGSGVTNDSAQFQFGTAGRSVGSHTVAVTVTDVDNMSASCEFTVTVNRRPNNTPTVSLSVDKASVYACEEVTATATGNDPDNDPLTYSWTVDNQPHSGSAMTTKVNTCGMAGGAHTICVNVNDGRGGTASDCETFKVAEKITIQVDRRVDNIAKAQLDEVALKMQQNPNLMATATGYTDNTGSDDANEKMGLKRAEMVKDYLVKQHNIDPSRIETKSAGSADPVADNSTEAGRKQNRRVVVELYVR